MKNFIYYIVINVIITPFAKLSSSWQFKYSFTWTETSFIITVRPTR